MTEEEIKLKVVTFISEMIEAQNSHYNFDFFLHFDVDTGRDGDVRRLSYATYRDVELYELGVLMVDEVMHDRKIRGFEGLNPNDVVFNHSLRANGMDGFIVN